jgi:hypothetical protein
MHTAELVKIVDRVVLKAFPYSSYYVINGCREIAGWDQQRAAEHIEAFARWNQSLRHSPNSNRLC